MRRLMTLSDRVLSAFDHWFSSVAGVYQTLGAVLVIVVAERVFPSWDPSMFALMVWLTIYSAVTQPALAHTGAENAERLEAIERHVEALIEQLVATERIHDA